MSQYLSFYLKKKDDPSTYVCLGYFCTTPAREIAELGVFPYTDKDILLDPNTFSWYLENIKEEIEDIKRHLLDYRKESQEIEGTVFKCTSQEVAKMLIEKIEDIKNNIAYCEEVLEDWNWRIDLLLFIKDSWEYNKKDWDLYFSNC